MRGLNFALINFTLRIRYWAIGLHPGAKAFFRFTLYLFLAVFAAESQSLLIAAIIPIFVASLALASFLNGFWMVIHSLLLHLACSSSVTFCGLVCPRLLYQSNFTPALLVFLGSLDCKPVVIAALLSSTSSLVGLSNLCIPAFGPERRQRAYFPVSHRERLLSMSVHQFTRSRPVCIDR